MPDEEVTACTIDIPQAALDDLADRLARTRFSEGPPGEAYGVPVDYVTELVERWRTGYDWREWETRLNALPQFTTAIDGQSVHFLHVRSTNGDALPLILTHGWPGTVVEYLDVVEPLTRDFHLVIPSIPGFAFSGPATGWNRYRTARAWAELMRRLGYDRYGAVGNDVGSSISLELGRADPDHVIGVHVTQIFSVPSGDPAELEALDEGDSARLASLRGFMAEKGAYLALQSSTPQTLAHALADSPAGLLAWNAQLFGRAVHPDHVLTHVTIYWLTGTAGSSMRFYREDADARRPAEPTGVPVALAGFADDFFHSIRALARRDHGRIVSWKEYPGGGHYAAHQAPGTLAADIGAFFLSS
ncbi:epoxide hydrolase family protein [Nonomuraea sp. NPDC049152]|uniref:epoxide hydrolase family protein n=1 Tax=Nonomuraea sp. NPDC049152 TaxID=3154350 RepID=UPI0033D21A0C